MQFSTRYIVLFAAAVCGVCSIFVASSAVLLKERQDVNKALDVQKKVLTVAGLMGAGEKLPGEEVQRRYAKHVRPIVIELKPSASRLNTVLSTISLPVPPPMPIVVEAVRG